MKASKKTKSSSTHEAVKFQKDGYNLPSHDALSNILPINHVIVKGAKTEGQRKAKQEQRRKPEGPEATQTNKPNINHTYQVHHPHKRPPLHNFEDDSCMAEISRLQTKEVENYRSAMSKMAEDIIVLRTQVVTLEAANNQLRSDLSLHQDLKKDLLDDSDIDSMTKAEISKHIAALKFKLATETKTVASQRDRIQQLQNDLIKKNDSQKELLKLQRVHQQQHQDLQRLQSCSAKMETLEATVKQQEKVIEKMEKALDKQSGVVKKHRGETDKREEEKESALAEENRRLREEMDRIHQHTDMVTMKQSEQTKDTLTPDERLILLYKVNQAEARAETLQAQLEESSKQWGREKQEMLTRLSEHRYGFARTSTTIFHNHPSTSISASAGEQKPIK